MNEHAVLLTFAIMIQVILVGVLVIQVWQNKVLVRTTVDMADRVITSHNVLGNPTAGAIHEQMKGRVALEREKRTVGEILAAKQDLNRRAILAANKPLAQRPPITLRPTDEPVLRPTVVTSEGNS